MAMLPTSPPSLTWGMSPYASDSPPTDDPEIPEDMQVGMGMMAYPGEEYIGPPVFDDYDMNRYIQPETEVPSDRRSWCDFLSSPDDDVKEGTPRFFDDSHVADICGDDGMGDDGFGLGGGGSAWRGMNLDFSGFLASGGTM